MDAKAASKLLRRWRDGAAGFRRFLADARPRVLARGKLVEFSPFPWQEEVIEAAYEPDLSTLVISAPRRSGKTELASLITLHKAIIRPRQTVLCLACSLDQTLAVNFAEIRNIILRTPALVELIGRENVAATRITLPGGTEIVAVTSSEASSFGRGVDILAATELAQADSDAAFNALQAGTADRAGLTIVDSTVGPRGAGGGAALWRMYEAAQEGVPGIRFIYKTWAPGQPPLSPLVDADWLAARARTTLPGDFQRFFCNLWGEGGSLLFPMDRIIRVPAVPTIDELRARYGYVATCMGGDFALAGSANADRSYLVLAAQGQGALEAIGPEPVWPGQPREQVSTDREDYHILAVVEAPTEADRRRAFEEFSRQLGGVPDQSLLEAYQAQSFAEYVTSRRGAVQIVHPSRSVQAEVFAAFHKRVSEGLVHIPQGGAFDELVRQMSVFTVDTTTNVPTFSARNKGRGGADRQRDDAVFAAGYAISGLKSWAGQHWGTF